MDSNEQFVRKRWEHVHYADTAFSVLAGPHYVIIGGYSYGPLRFAVYRHTAAEVWQAAREFTEMRLEEIRQIKEALLELRKAAWVDLRKLDPLEKLGKERLAALKQGMK